MAAPTEEARGWNVRKGRGEEGKGGRGKKEGGRGRRKEDTWSRKERTTDMADEFTACGTTESVPEQKLRCLSMKIQVTF
jgi:hypothetical protein